MKNVLESKIERINELYSQLKRIEGDLNDLLGIEDGTDFRQIEQANKRGAPLGDRRFKKKKCCNSKGPRHKKGCVHFDNKANGPFSGKEAEDHRSDAVLAEAIKDLWVEQEMQSMDVCKELNISLPRLNKIITDFELHRAL